MKLTTETFGFEASDVTTNLASDKKPRVYLAISNEDAANDVYVGIGKNGSPDHACKRIPPKAEWEPRVAPREALYICCAAGLTAKVNITESVEHD